MWPESCEEPALAWHSSYPPYNCSTLGIESRDAVEFPKIIDCRLEIEQICRLEPDAHRQRFLAQPTRDHALQTHNRVPVRPPSELRVLMRAPTYLYWQHLQTQAIKGRRTLRGVRMEQQDSNIPGQ
eukprot:1119206_1